MDVPQQVDFAAYFTPQMLFGHFTYLLMIVSFLMRNIAWLRALAISAGLAKIIYRLFLVFDPVSVFWETAFVLVNIGQLLVIWWENRPPSFTPEEQQFVDIVAPTLPPRVSRALLRSGRWADVPVGTALTTEGKPVNALIFIASGKVQIQRGGLPVGSCAAGDFLGEMTYASGKAATATAVALEPLRTLNFERQALEAAQTARPMLRLALQASFNRNLIDKLVRSNAAVVPLSS